MACRRSRNRCRARSVHRRSARPAAGDLTAARRASPIPSIRRGLLSPVANPGKIIAAPVNYKKHLEKRRRQGIRHGNLVSEIRKAGMFLKGAELAGRPGRSVKLVHLEPPERPRGRAGVVIGRKARNVRGRAPGCIAGYCIRPRT